MRGLIWFLGTLLFYSVAMNYKILEDTDDFAYFVATLLSVVWYYVVGKIDFN